MGTGRLPNLHDSGAMTPPPTPTKGSHSKSDSASSLRGSFDSVRRGNAITYRCKPSIDEKETPGSTEPRHFPYWTTDYEIEVDHKGRKRPLGCGAWSNVCRATPRPPKLEGLAPLNTVPGVDMTPPVTPVHSRNSSRSEAQVPQIPSAYAVKEPCGRTAQRVLGDECRILSYLSRYPDAEKYIVPFYGQDTRTDALVLGLMDGTLEDWIQKDLDSLSEESRAAKLAHVFPTLAAHLLDGFIWISEKHCTHGDLKPANILISSTPSSATSTSTSPPHAVYTDFSSAILSTSSTSSSPVGGATYDFLDPALMTKASASTLPTPQTDLWSLAVTLLVLAIGSSPYSRVTSNEFMKKECIKQGTPLAYMRQGENGTRNGKRMDALEGSLGFDVEEWLGLVLVKDVMKRAGVDKWRAELGSGGAKMGLRI
ncbi:kinase-like protein [Lentithecium fluviatile CBS 122367]|uniref:Autophagy-related protein 1 n=1 Tax=Lentithecium fluviatile CBS 122367 TaxID=1168545 RepID=A0A6G1IYC5_9PLEO|nr:kinase-like protein [Lentithecium fluviatile CBS 122367]